MKYILMCCLFLLGCSEASRKKVCYELMVGSTVVRCSHRSSFSNGVKLTECVLAADPTIRTRDINQAVNFVEIPLGVE